MERLSPRDYPPPIMNMMGTTVTVNAPNCGSGAYRLTHIWQILIPNKVLETAFSHLPIHPVPIDALLAAAGLSDWRA